MKWIESTQGKILVNGVGCSQRTKRQVCTSQFFLALFRSSCKQSVRGDTDTFFALNILACENAASSDVCIFYTFRATHLPKRQCLFFKVLLLDTSLTNPAVLTLASH